VRIGAEAKVPHRTRAMARTAHRGKHHGARYPPRRCGSSLAGYRIVGQRQPAWFVMRHPRAGISGRPGDLSRRAARSRLRVGAAGEHFAEAMLTNRLPVGRRRRRTRPVFPEGGQPNRPAQNSLPSGSASPVQWVVKSLRRSTWAPTETEPPVMRGPVDHDDRGQGRSGGSAGVLLEPLSHSGRCGLQLPGIRPVANGPSQP
jgi:hypothetical protein